MTQARASSMPLLKKCSALLTVKGQKIDHYHPAADTGTAVHEAIEQYVLNSSVMDPYHLASKHGVEHDVDEIAWMANYGRKLFDSMLRSRMPHPLVEVYMEHAYASNDGFTMKLTGHADLLCYRDDGTVIVLDWKTGRHEGDHYAQLLTYGWLAKQHRPDGYVVERVVAMVVYLRSGNYESWEWTRSEIESEATEMFERIAGERGKYSPGEHCQYCPVYVHCEARRLMAREAVASLERDGGVLTDQGWATRGTVKRAVYDMEDTVKDRIRQAKDGRVDLGGSVLSLDKRTRSEIDIRVAWPILTKYLDTDTLAGAMTMSKTKVERSLRALRLNVAEILEELEEAGAIQTSTTETLQTRKGKATR